MLLSINEQGKKEDLLNMLKPEAKVISNDDQGTFCNAVLAPYAVKPHETKGRLHKEEESARRSPYERDRDRIIHARAFRRLKHKTQVFVSNEGDHYRTRLTHSLEVAQIARSLARTLRLNEDLAETIALAHDLGHTPFAHLGEDALRECLKKRGTWFNHNEQTFRIVTELEQSYPEFDGLNLTWESLEGIAKHNGPVTEMGDKKLKAIHAFSEQFDLKLHEYASAEAQVAGLADDIAYNNHDLDDGLRAGFFTLDDLLELPHAKPVIEKVRAKYPGVKEKRLIPEVIRELIGNMISDLIAESLRRIEKIKPKSADDIRECGQMIIGFSDEYLEQDKILRKFLWNRMYTHNREAQKRFKMSNVVKDIFECFIENPKCMPERWYNRIEHYGLERTVIDYIAGMTDKYALKTYRALYDPQFQEI